VGSEAKIYIPLLWENSVVRESNRILWEKGKLSEKKPADVSFLGREENSLVFKVESGYYPFKARKARKAQIKI